MIPKPTIYIISSAHNQLEYTKKLLNSLIHQKYSNYKIIFVDDGSKDGTSEFINKHYFQEVSLIKGDGNLWWTGSIYKGVEKALKTAKDADFILTINNDCLVDKNYLTTLVSLAVSHPKTIIGSLVVDMNDKSTIVDGGVQIDWAKGQFIKIGSDKINSIFPKVNFISNIDTLSTKGTLYPVQVFRNIGNFDQLHLPHYISDYEFAIRAKNNGFSLLLSYEAKVYNVSTNTGFGEKLPDKISYRQFFNFLFGRKSRINIVDHFWFITLCCPSRYKLRNYLLLLGKSLYLLNKTFPFYYFK